jgi:hypothetical protein
MLDSVARADCRDALALAHDGAAGDCERTEVEQRHREPAGSLDRDSAAVAGHAAGEAHDARRRSADVRPGQRPDVDPAVESAGVGVVSEQEWS